MLGRVSFYIFLSIYAPTLPSSDTAVVLTFYVFFFFILEIQNKSGFVNEEDTAKNEKEEENKSPKDNIWSAIPVALLCTV